MTAKKVSKAASSRPAKKAAGPRKSVPRGSKSAPVSAPPAPAAAGELPRCAAGFPIWNAAGQCRRCIIAGRDTCAGQD